MSDLQRHLRTYGVASWCLHAMVRYLYSEIPNLQSQICTLESQFSELRTRHSHSMVAGGFDEMS